MFIRKKELEQLKKRLELLEFKDKYKDGYKIMSHKISYICGSDIETVDIPFGFYIYNKDTDIFEDVLTNNKYKINKAEKMIIQIVEVNKVVAEQVANDETTTEQVTATTIATTATATAATTEQTTNNVDEPKRRYKMRLRGNSLLADYYDKNHLNLRIDNYNCNNITEKEMCALLYLYDMYKYDKEIIRHIPYQKQSLTSYAYKAKTAGYLIYEHGMGRVKNGCLIYVK